MADVPLLLGKLPQVLYKQAARTFALHLLEKNSTFVSKGP